METCSGVGAAHSAAPPVPGKEQGEQAGASSLPGSAERGRGSTRQRGTDRHYGAYNQPLRFLQTKEQINNSEWYNEDCVLFVQYRIAIYYFDVANK